MKRLNILVIIVILIMLLCCLFLIHKKNIIIRDIDERINELQVNDSLYKFNEPKIKEKGKIVSPDTNYNEIPLLLEKDVAYNVCIPASMKIVTDYSTYIYGVDSTFRINVVKGVKQDNISSSMALLNTYEYDTNIITTKPNMKKPQEVGVLLYNDVGIVASCYDDPLSYATILFGISKNSVYDCSDCKSYENSKITQYYNSPIQISIQENENYKPFIPSMTDMAGATQYFYNDGELIEIASMKSFDETRIDIEQRIGLANKGSRCYDNVYKKDESYFYGECGECTILIIASTYNRTYALFGIGQEARNNIAIYLRNNN